MFNEKAPMFVGFAGSSISAAQECATNASSYTVIEGRGIEGDLLISGLCHSGILLTANYSTKR